MTDPAGLLLIVDDDAVFLERLGRAMEKRGYRVVLADGVKAALAAAEEEPPSWAVVDLRLLDGSGLDVEQALRRQFAFQRQLILQTLAQTHCNWAEAARRLQLDRANLQRLAKRLGISTGRVIQTEHGGAAG